MTFEKLKVGEVYYDVGKRTMGNTTMKTVCVWPVKILEIDAEKRECMVSWNGNPPTRWTEHTWKKLKSKRPELIRSITGAYRLKKKDETP